MVKTAIIGGSGYTGIELIRLLSGHPQLELTCATSRQYEGQPVENPDLSKVDEVGFTDLMRGGQSRACSRLDWIEVFGFPVERDK